MSKAKKLPSGAWNIRVYSHTEGGKKIYKSITRDTKAECEYAAAEFKCNEKQKATKNRTVRSAIEKYIKLSEMLSPTTIANYEVILNCGFETIMDMEVCKLDDTAMQVAINAEAKRMNKRTGKPLSPKTVKNEWGLLSAALKTVCNKSFNVRLPSVQHKNKILPEPQIIMNAIIGTDSELPCLLAMWCGLRLEEIRGLQFRDIQNGYLYINRVVVDVHNKPVVKTDAKTDSSIRGVKLPSRIETLIQSTQEKRKAGQEDFIVLGTHSEIYGAFRRLVKPYGIKLRFHDLRHVYASSLMNVIGIPTKLVQLEGGWSSEAVLTRNYSQAITSAQLAADEARDKYFESLITK